MRVFFIFNVYIGKMIMQSRVWTNHMKSRIERVRQYLAHWFFVLGFFWGGVVCLLSVLFSSDGSVGQGPVSENVNKQLYSPSVSAG